MCLFLESISARQLREYKASFAISRINLSGSRPTDMLTRSPLKSLPRGVDDNTSFNGHRELVDEPHQNRGRGRGKGKTLPVVQRESLGLISVKEHTEVVQKIHIMVINI